MKKLQLFFIFLVTPIILFATIDECKTDIYFANGILTSPDEAKKSATLLRTTVIKKTKKFGKTSLTYLVDNL